MRAYLLLLAASSAAAFSALSSFARRTPFSGVTQHSQHYQSQLPTITMYDSSRESSSSPELNSWHVLASTERWISATLADQNSPKASSSNASTNNNNPYTRKEVSYACESFVDSPMIVASIFRRLKEAREVGEKHAKAQLELKQKCQGTIHNRKTTRADKDSNSPHPFSHFRRRISTQNASTNSSRCHSRKSAISNELCRL
jgi:hypothetical protein